MFACSYFAFSEDLTPLECSLSCIGDGFLDSVPKAGGSGSQGGRSAWRPWARRETLGGTEPRAAELKNQLCLVVLSLFLELLVKFSEGVYFPKVQACRNMIVESEQVRKCLF